MKVELGRVGDSAVTGSAPSTSEAAGAGTDTRPRPVRVPSPTQEDRHKAMELLASICNTDTIHVLVATGEPASKARPRVGKGGRVFTPAATRSAEEALAYQLLRLPTFASNVAVACIFYRSNKQRIDLDNLTKLVLDASTKGQMWEDDSQVTAIFAHLELDTDRPRTVIAFARHESSMTRGESAKVACKACGSLFVPQGTKTQHCSRECRITLAEPIICPSCRKPFKRKNGNQRYCSNECRHLGRSRTYKARTHCRNGHEYTPENTHVLPDGRRRCRTCQAANARTYRREKQLPLLSS